MNEDTSQNTNANITTFSIPPVRSGSPSTGNEAGSRLQEQRRASYITVLRSCTADDGTISMQTLELDIDRWNRAYNLVDALSSASTSDPRLHDPTFMVLMVDIRPLVTHYQHLTTKQLRSLASFHGVTWRGYNKPMITALLIAHECTLSCNTTFYVFKETARMRPPWMQRTIQGTPVPRRPPTASANSVPASTPPQNDRVDYDNDVVFISTDDTNTLKVSLRHLKGTFKSAKDGIIKEWQKEMDPARFIRRACAVCSGLMFTHEMERLHASEITLHLLRNDDLPVHVLPTSYAFEEYNRAILDPEGLEDCQKRGWMTVCPTCARDLDRGEMPRFALANWLYYARDRLPQDVRKVFDEISIFEKALIARLRTNSILCRFTGIDPDINGASFATGRRHVRGNIISTPMDTARIYDVLPPAPSEIADTICALIVSDKVPTRANIDSLEPILVRKSRVKLLIQFLIENNHHYKLTHSFRGFSAEHLDALFSGNRGSGVPSHVRIAHIPVNEAVESGVSDYTRRFENLDGLFMENVSYTLGDHSPQSFREMTLLALQRCKSGRPFLHASPGKTPIPDIDNPNWLSWAHPNADPFGLGGFHDPRRTRPIGMELQLRHLLNVRDPFFESDPELAFSVYNIIRKHSVNNSLRFCVPYTSYSRVVNDILRMNKDVLSNLQAKFKRNSQYKPTTAEELHVLRTMSSISPVARHIPGTTAQKIKMRNEIRAIISQKGSPTLFVTLNPADYYNPIVTVLAKRASTETEVLALHELSTSERASIAIQHPVACAQFFDAMIKAFVKVILRFGRKDGKPGLFGECDAYYGTVETQGRGSLHCHMLIWLKGHLPPETLQCAITSSEQYRNRLTHWLDSIVDTGFIGSRSFLNNLHDASDEELGRTKEPHPGTIPGPMITEMDKDSFEKEMNEYVDELLLRFNWHGHSASCWKYLAPGEKRSPESCRFGMDGIVRAATVIDAQAGTIAVRRRHPKMTQYNPVLTFLMKCNTDIKFIGSGVDAKAFMYYVTVYITKSPLTMHAGLSALSYAIEKGENRGIFAEASSEDTHGRRIMTLALNSMLGCQELSHPQVMSYIAGGGENYTSERFQAVNWAEIVKYVTTSHEADRLQAGSGTQCLGMTVNREDGRINVSNQLLDYIFRPETEPYHSMGLYRFISSTAKCPKKKPASTSERSPPRQSSGHPFSSEAHPQFESRLLTLRAVEVVPVLLGPRISKNKGSDTEKEEWARDMCILFRPWRCLSDLKPPTCNSWVETLDSTMPMVKEKDKTIMSNMSLIAEGKSARDSRPRGRRRGPEAQQSHEPADENTEGDAQGDDSEELEGNVFSLITRSAHQNESTEADTLPDRLEQHLRDLIGSESTTAFRSCMPAHTSAASQAPRQVPFTESQDPIYGQDSLLRATQYAFMISCKNRDADSPDTQSTPSGSSPNPSSRQQLSSASAPTVVDNPQPPTASIGTLHDSIGLQRQRTNSWNHVERIIDEREIRLNPEQLKAFRIVAHHVIEGGPQLLIPAYLRSIASRCTTGIAASLIGGNTLHSLLNLAPNNRKRSRNDKTAREWRSVKYLITDEVSMVGAHFMATISANLRAAKADNSTESVKLFGGINMIFMGDFYQLSPPKQPSLFAHRLVKNPTFAQIRDNVGIDAMAGAFLWRQVDTVVLLRQSKRHAKDPLFGEILQRIRTNTNIMKDGRLQTFEGKTIIEHLRQRELTRVFASNPSELHLFQDAPVIVGSKIIRDALNACLLVAHAKRLHVDVHLYHATDQVRGKPLSRPLSNRLQSLPTHSSNETLGLLPLFIGMRVMITENVSVPYKVVNGSEGEVIDIAWSLNDHGQRTADVVYVKIPRCAIEAPGLPRGIVPLFPTSVSISHPINIGQLSAKSFRRRQIPIVPAYSYTDYKSQGRTLERAIVDITSARGQGIYVMLSRVTSLNGLLILRWFPNNRILQRMSAELRSEVNRINELDTHTHRLYQRGVFQPVNLPSL
ncbi:hypothetical protein NMY22_g893 [Coprinellus aureogranulatus]|nr:hypothetical protein NMY22_g893 [Coprinellus aureogranulatus]